MKCVLRCRHLVSESESGVTLQVYFAIIASLLIGLRTGVKPSKRTYEIICFYLSGWATAEEVVRHLLKLQQAPGPPKQTLSRTLLTFSQRGEGGLKHFYLPRPVIGYAVSWNPLPLCSPVGTSSLMNASSASSIVTFRQSMLSS